MREDQDAERARRLDEAGGGDRLARRGRMAEAVAADRAGILLRRELLRQRLLVGLDDASRPRPRSSSSLRLELLDRRRAVAVAVRLLVALRRRDQLGEHPGERVDLVAAERGAGGGVRLGVGEHALEAEHQAVAHLPGGARVAPAGLDLGERVVERAPARRSRREHLVPDPRPREGMARPPTPRRGMQRRQEDLPPRRGWSAEWLPACAQHVDSCCRTSKGCGAR